MPGNASWKEIFQLEYQQLFEEGYPVGKDATLVWPCPYLPFLEEGTRIEDVSARDWKRGYKNLWKVRQKGLRPDYPFVEPDDYPGIIADAQAPPALLPLGETEYAEKVKGAWFGRCAGVVLGKPFESGLDRPAIKEYLESVDAYPLADFAPLHSDKLGKGLRQDCMASTRGHVHYVQPDDDIHYTILSLLLTEKKGLSFSALDIGQLLLDNIPYHWLFSATRQAYYHFVNIEEDRPLDNQIRQMSTKINPWREGINGAIRADFWGYIAPGEPRRAAKLAHQAIRFNTAKNGIYGAMFVAGCISAALSRSPTLETILQGGLSVIPQKSRLASVVEQVTGWYAGCHDWVTVCDKIYDQYGHLPFSGCLNNMAWVVLALIHGQLDFSRTITTAVMCGTDTDCTAGTAGSITGAAVGYAMLDPRWILPLNDRVKTVVAGFGEGTITDLVKRTVAARQLNTNRDNLQSDS